MSSEKKPYSTPMLIVYGDVKEITQGTSDGDYLDADFPAGTKRNALTFS